MRFRTMLHSLVAAVTLLALLPAWALADKPFSPAIKISDNTVSHSSNNDRSGKCTVAAGNAVYTVWLDWRNSISGGWDDDVYLAKSVDGGKSYGPSVRVTTSAGNNANYPTVAADGNYVYVAWHDYPGPNIYFTRSTDGGATFAPKFRVDTSPYLNYQGRVSMTTDKQGTLYVVWEERGGNGDPIGIYVAKSTDHGATFSPKVRVSPDSTAWVMLATDVAVDDAGNLYVAWMDNYWPDAHIVISASRDGGATFATHVTPDPSTVYQVLPQLVARGDGEVLVTWLYQSVMYSRSTDHGATFSSPKQLADTPASGRSGLAKDSTGTIFAAWDDSSSGVPAIYMTYSRDGGATFAPSVKVNDRPIGTVSGSITGMPSIAVTSDGNAAITWTDYANGVIFIAGAGALYDFTPPVTTASAPSGWATSDALVSLAATDTQSGVKEIRYSLDNGPETVVTGAAATYLVTIEGCHTVGYYAVDNAGNAEPARAMTVCVDKTAPAITATLRGTMGLPGWYRSNVTFTCSAADAVSGVKQISYSVDNGTPVTVARGSFTGTLATAGVHTVTCSAADKAGNNSSPAASSFTIDKTAPKVLSTVPANGGAGILTTSTIVITFSEPVVAGAGFNNITLKRGTTTVAASKTISGNTLTIKSGTALAKNTNYTVSLPANGVTDQAGNPMAAPYSFSFKTGAK